MKKCSTNTSLNDVADAIRNHKIANLYSGKAETQEEGINRLQLLDRFLETKEENGKRVYGVVGLSIDKASIKETFTTEGTKKFEQKMGPVKSAEINKSPLSILQRDTGTYLHNSLENIIQALATTTYKDKVLIRPGTYKNLTQLKGESRLNESEFNKLIKTAQKLISDAIEKQTKKDPTGKVYVATEQRLMASSVLAGTADLLFLYSDVTVDHFDYKTMSPKGKNVQFKGGKAFIVDPDWIPFYKYEDWNLQLPKTTYALLNVIGVNAVEKSRIIPMQLVLESKDGKPTDKIKQIETFATSEDYLDQIPIQEKTGDAAIDKSLSSLYILKENMLAELSDSISLARRTYLKNRVDNITKTINSIIIKRDISNIIDDYKRVIGKYADFENKVYPKLRNVIDENIDDKNNPTYLSTQEHQELLNELSLISSVIAASYEFYNRMGIDEKEYAKYRNDIDRLSSNLGVLVSQLQNELFNRIKLQDSTLAEFDNAKNVGQISQMFNTFGEIQHPAFREAFKRVSKAETDARVKLQDFKITLDKVAVELENYSKSNGLGLFGAYNKMINKETGNLYAKHNKQFYIKLKEAQENKNEAYFNKYYQLKEDSIKKYNEYLTKIIQRENWDEKKDIKKIQNFIERNKLEDLKFDPNKYNWYYEMKPEYKNSLSTEIYSPEYIEIQKTPALKNYYDFWIKTMQEFREITGMNNDYSALPDNFIPYFRASLIEQMYEGGLPKAAWEQFIGIFKQQSDDTEFGYMTELAKKRDINTGEILHDIPLFGLNPLYNKEGVIDHSLKSYNLTRTLYTFANIAYNYQGLKKIEAEVAVLGNMIADFGISQTDASGKLVKTIAGGYAKLTGHQLKLYNTFQTLIKSSIYGITEQGEAVNKEITKVLSSANNFQRMVKLGLEPILQISAGGASKIASFYEGVKGYYYNKSQQGKSEVMLSKIFTEEGKLTSAILQYFEFHGKHVNVKANELPDNALVKLANKGLSFLGFRKSSEWVDNSIGLSMMQNYGIDENGKIKRLKSLPKDSKSLLEKASLKNGKLEIDGINLDNYNQFINMVRGVSRGIKGELSDNDQRAITQNILGKLAMTYKSWLPDLFKEHWHPDTLRYNNYTDTVTIGRFNAIYENLKGDESKKWLLLNQAAWVGIGKLALDVPLSLFTMGKVRLSKANENRARALFEKFKQDNPYDKRIQEFSFEDFLDYYNGQIRAGVSELSILLFLIGIGMMMGGDWDDDGKKDYHQHLILNWSYRVVNRMRRELGFFYGSEGFDMLAQSSLPVTGVLLDGKKAIVNFVDEAYHDIFNIKDPYDKTGYFYYTSKEIPIVYPILKIFDTERDR